MGSSYQSEVDSYLQRQPTAAGSRDPEYQKFIEETGFQFERDLDQAAFAIHYRKVGATAQPDQRQNRVSPRFSLARSTPAASRVPQEGILLGRRLPRL